jgi:hypothetical protein
MCAVLGQYVNELHRLCIDHSRGPILFLHRWCIDQGAFYTCLKVRVMTFKKYQLTTNYGERNNE